MSDEAAFLAVLKANPADDTARLVYADWLDEHDQPRKAEYLRLMCELAKTGPVVSLASPVLAPLLDLNQTVSPDWVVAACSRFDLHLVGCAPGRQVASIRSLQEITGLGMPSAKKVTENLPACLFASGPVQILAKYERQLNSAEAEVRCVTTGSIEAAAVFRFDAYVSGYGVRESRWSKLPSVVAELFSIDIGGLPRWNNSEDILLARGLDAYTAGRMQTRLREVPDPEPPSDENQSYTHVFNLRIIPVAPS